MANETRSTLKSGIDTNIADGGGNTAADVRSELKDIIDSAATQKDENTFEAAQKTKVDPVNVKAYGAVGDGTTDDTSDIQSALDYAEANGGIVFFPPSDYLIGTGGLSTNARHIYMPPGATLLYNDGGNPCIQIGAQGSTIQRANYVLSTKRKNADWDSATGDGTDSSSIGVLMVNVVRSQITVRRSISFDTGFELRGDGNGCTANRIYCGEVRENRRQVICTQVDTGSTGTTGFTNNNNFIGGQLRISSQHTKQVAGSRYLDLGASNGCLVVGVNLENDMAERSLYTDNVENTFIQLRLEANQDGAVEFDSNSAHCLMLNPRGGGSTSVAPDSALYTDNGTGNQILGESALKIGGSITITKNDQSISLRDGSIEVRDNGGNMEVAAGGDVTFFPGNTSMWQVQTTGILKAMRANATGGTSSKDPTTTAPDGWLEVEFHGTTYYLPAYLE